MKPRMLSVVAVSVSVSVMAVNPGCFGEDTTCLDSQTIFLEPSECMVVSVGKRGSCGGFLEVTQMESAYVTSAIQEAGTGNWAEAEVNWFGTLVGEPSSPRFEKIHPMNPAALRVCAQPDAPVGATAKLVLHVINAPDIQITYNITIGAPDIYQLDVKVPVEMNPSSVLVDNGRTIVAANTDINVEATPTDDSLSFDASSNGTWNGSTPLTVVAPKKVTGVVRFPTPGPATVLLQIDGVANAFTKDVVVKGPTDPLASATIREEYISPTGPCTGDADERAQVGPCNQFIYCIDASRSREKWTDPSELPTQIRYAAYDEFGNLLAIPIFVSPRNSSAAAVCRTPGVSFRVIVNNQAGFDDAVTLNP